MIKIFLQDFLKRTLTLLVRKNAQHIKSSNPDEIYFVQAAFYEASVLDNSITEKDLRAAAVFAAGELDEISEDMGLESRNYENFLRAYWTKFGKLPNFIEVDNDQLAMFEEFVENGLFLVVRDRFYNNPREKFVIDYYLD